MTTDKKIEPFWKRRAKHGRDKLFASPEKLWEAACEYFQYCDDNPWMSQEKKTSKQGKVKSSELKSKPLGRPYTMVALCLYLDCSEGYFRYMKATYDPVMDEDFLAILSKIELTVRSQQLEGASTGVFNANIVARLQGLTDKKDISSSDGSMTPKETTVVVKDKKTADEVNKLINGND